MGPFIDRALQWQHRRCARIAIALKAFKNVFNQNARCHQAIVSQFQSIHHAARFDMTARRTKLLKPNTMRNSSDAESKTQTNIIYEWRQECNGVVVSSMEIQVFQATFSVYSCYFTLLLWFCIGCLVNSNFYPEGHRLPRNETNPCEICFCIGGSKRCTPKKCAPMIRNCRPIVPEGQCCPSSYDCSMYSFITFIAFPPPCGAARHF